MPKRPRVKPIRDPTLFEMGKLEEAGRLANLLKVERPYAEPGLFLGTSAFTAAGWQGSFYPVWDKTVVDRKDDLKRCVDILRQLVFNKNIRKTFAFSNNHYGGFGPGMVKLFWGLWENQ